MLALESRALAGGFFLASVRKKKTRERSLDRCKSEQQPSLMSHFGASPLVLSCAKEYAAKKRSAKLHSSCSVQEKRFK